MSSNLFAHGVILGAGLTSGCLIVLGVASVVPRLFSLVVGWL